MVKAERSLSKTKQVFGTVRHFTCVGFKIKKEYMRSETVSLTLSPAKDPFVFSQRCVNQAQLYLTPDSAQTAANSSFIRSFIHLLY